MFMFEYFSLCLVTAQGWLISKAHSTYCTLWLCPVLCVKRPGFTHRYILMTAVYKRCFHISLSEALSTIFFQILHFLLMLNKCCSVRFLIANLHYFVILQYVLHYCNNALICVTDKKNDSFQCCTYGWDAHFSVLAHLAKTVHSLCNSSYCLNL